MDGFKNGDNVEILSSSYSSSPRMNASYIRHGYVPAKGYSGTVLAEGGDGYFLVKYRNHDGGHPTTMAIHYSNLKITSNSSHMTSLSLIEKIKLATKQEPEKSFITAGIMTMAGDLTSEGKEAFIQYLLEENKADFNTKIVQPLLAYKPE